MEILNGIAFTLAFGLGVPEPLAYILSIFILFLPIIGIILIYKHFKNK